MGNIPLHPGMHVIVRAAMGMGHTIVEVYPAMGVSDALSVIPISQQFYGIGILCVFKNITDTAAFHDFSLIHDIDTVRHIFYQTQVMGDE